MDKHLREELEYWRAKKRGKEAVALEKSKSPAPKPDKLPVEVIKQGNASNYFMGIKQIGSTMLLVGIPADTRTALHRRQSIQKKIEKYTGPLTKKRKENKKKLLQYKKESELSNAYLLSIFERGSPLRQQPGRSVLKASLFNKPTKTKISEMLAAAAAEQMAGNEEHAKLMLERVGQFAAQAARDWFDNPANGWAGNAPSTIRMKGFDKPGEFYGLMKKAITYVMKDYSNQSSEVGK